MASAWATAFATGADTDGALGELGLGPIDVQAGMEDAWRKFGRVYIDRALGDRWPGEHALQLYGAPPRE